MNAAARRTLDEISTIRRLAIGQGRWPPASVAMWRELATRARARLDSGCRLEAADIEAMALFPDALEAAA